MVTLSKKLIEKLYYKERLSANDIAKKLGTTVWVVLGFMSRNNIPRRTFKEANRICFENKPLTFLIKKNLSAKEKELKLAGVFIYWAEGAKFKGMDGIPCTVDLANSDPKMISLFLRFLREICGVDEDKLGVQLYCYADQDIEILKNFWYKRTSIASKKFIKPYVRNDFLPEKSGKMKYGLVHIRYTDKKLLYQIDNWIKEYCKKFKILVN
jgi:hypothetical protein